ncbi:MAG TPA: CsiV family protein, partial [Aliidiomarina sp.]|nr:CsiV family protein [Aliidiomarina sp.]
FNLREPEIFSQQLSSVEEQANAWLQGEVEEVPFLRAYHLKQLRRVISHEIHYFDHPKFGILVEIRRTDRSQR